MKAIVCMEYGTPDVLQLKEVTKPTQKDNEVLIRVHATSVNFGDLMARNFKAVSPRKFNMLFLFWLLSKISFGLRKPNITSGSAISALYHQGRSPMPIKIMVFSHLLDSCDISQSFRG